MNVAEQTALAIRNYANLRSATTGSPVDDAYRTTPNRLAYALGWIVANAIVAARYQDSAIDALPVYHPERGWDRFLLTRRVSCCLAGREPADAFGAIMLSGADAPRLTGPGGDTRLALGQRLRDDPRRAIDRVLDLLPPVGLLPGDHTACPHVCAATYPTLYDVTTEAILEHPGLIAARELLIDDRPIDGLFHPLYLHTAGRTWPVVYDWFELRSPERVAFFRIHGESAVYESDDGRWSSVAKPLADGDRAEMKRRILAWLRIGGRPDPATVD